MIDRFLLAHKGPGATELGDDPLERMALHLHLAGRVDLPSLRLERTLSGSADMGTRLLVLSLFARLRSGHPHADASEIVNELRDGLESNLERIPKEFDAKAHGALVARAKERGQEVLRASVEGILSAPDTQGDLFGSTDREPLPLVVVREGRFSFARFHAAQAELVARVGERIRVQEEIEPSRAAAVLTEIDALPGWPLHVAQREAVAAALRCPFLVLTGGPGTGKTTVVSRILLALSRCLPGFDPESVALCAPTGRAKARLSESLGQNLASLAGADPMASALASLQAHTLHSLLGALPDGNFRYRAENPLPHRVVVLDEASMVDLPLFASFLSALSPRARLVVVGDPDQLPSVDAGAVLADLVANPHLQAIRAHLSHTHRNAGAIAEICRIAREGGDVARLLESRRQDPSEMPASRTLAGEVSQLHGGTLESILPSWLEDRFGAAMRKVYRVGEGFHDPVALLDLVERSRILCAVHDGKSGALALNATADTWLRGTFPSAWRGRFVPGQQVILVRNHPLRDLWNGDLGVVLEHEARLMAVFAKSGKILSVPVEQLDGLESAWAITVHKSQGSEFDEILFALPERDSPVLTRQILYTALSRARRTVFVHGDAELATKAVARNADRPGKLREMAG